MKIQSHASHLKMRPMDSIFLIFSGTNALMFEDITKGSSKYSNLRNREKNRRSMGNHCNRIITIWRIFRDWFYQRVPDEVKAWSWQQCVQECLRSCSFKLKKINTHDEGRLPIKAVVKSFSKSPSSFILKDNLMNVNISKMVESNSDGSSIVLPRDRWMNKYTKRNKLHTFYSSMPRHKTIESVSASSISSSLSQNGSLIIEKRPAWKMIDVLKNSPILKNTLLGRMLNLKKREKVKFFRQKSLLRKIATESKFTKTAKNLIYDAEKSDESDSWVNNNQYEEKIVEETEYSCISPMVRRDFDLESEPLEESKANQDIIESPCHLFTNGVIQEMEEETEGKNDALEVNISKIRTMERYNTPNINRTKLVNDQNVFKKSSTNMKMADKKKFLPYKKPKRKINMKKLRKLVKKSRVLMNTEDIRLGQHQKLEKTQKEYAKLLLFIIGQGEASRLIDFLEGAALIQSSAINQPDEDGNTPFSVACQNGDSEIVEILIKAGAELNTQNNKGNTPLHYACTYNFIRVRNLLIKNGANETIKNHGGRIPWEGI
ncbi:unnamed protein product [Moneuplotes crassus]|uniref:Uncharacterized protein n=1 Tax=Euplotes crassus TaxID=5936 RepID=A0AAD2D7P6_EUPCR|nr:unnamed protein product [Moneuplotes crassus]